MKQILFSALCFFLIAVSLYAQNKKEPKVITIHSVRVMELFKKENKAQYRTKPDQKETEHRDEKNTTAAEGVQKDITAGTAENDQTNDTDLNDTDLKEENGQQDDSSAERMSVTAEEAQKAVDEKKDEIIVFSGGVSLSVKEGSIISTIEADKVIYNRSENTIEAEGNVKYGRKSGSSDEGESFIGELLLFNLDDMEGVFLDGTIKQAPRKKGDNPFTIQSATIGRDASGTTGFKNAVLSTNADIDEDPLWSIRATRIWMLPGNELAFVNGYFSIGVVPLIYLPFFYHPVDEMIFHPVFGFRNREGYFVQTTTYLFGRKPLDTNTKASGSFSNFLKSNRLKKQQRTGLFLKNLDEDASNNDPSYIKLIADTYSSLGGVVGIDGKTVPENTPIKQLDFSLMFGMSRTLYPLPKSNVAGFSHSAYDAKGRMHYNESTFYGESVPFRYRAHVNFSISKDPFQFSLRMPFVSDPYFKKDFFDRAEDMNWFSYLLNRERLAKGNDIGTESSYSWKIDGSVRSSFKQLDPWVSSFNIDNASMIVEFSSKANKGLDPREGKNAPHREFFYPRLLKPEGRASIAGTLISNSMFVEKAKKTAPDSEPDRMQSGIENPFKKEDADMKQTDSAQQEQAVDDASDVPDSAEQKAKEKAAFLDDFIPVFKPQYGKGFDHSINYAVSYTGNFTALQEATFAVTLWEKPEDIKWTDYESRYYQLRGNAGLKGVVSYAQNLISLSSSLNIAGNYQRHPWVRDKKRLAVLELNNFKANVYTFKNENSVTVSPFVYTDLFKPISFNWTIAEILVKNTFTGTYENPRWKTEKVKWDKNFITTHTGSAVFGMIFIEKYTQKLTLTTNLPPLLQAYSSVLNLAFPYGTLTASAKFFEKEKAKKKWFWDPFKMELAWTFPYDIKASQAYIYNIEEKDNERLHLTFGWKYLSAFYTQNREIPHRLILGTGWTAKGTEKKFIPFATGFSFSNTSDPLTLYAWKNRFKVQLALASSLYFNLIRITDSYFVFAPKITFNIFEFWDLSFGASSRNDVIARYFQKTLSIPVVIPGNTNIITDLAHSFYFWDKLKRESSGFKLQSLEIGLIHNLKDWLLKFNCEIKPQQKSEGNRKYYVFTPTITFAVEWKPIGDIKIEAKKKDGKFSVERGEIR